MIDQHKKISGYRDLTQEEIDLMNRIKSFGPDLEKLVEDLRIYHEKQAAEALSKSDIYENQRLIRASPDAWRHAGVKALQQGLMFLTRSVAQPTFF